MVALGHIVADEHGGRAERFAQRGQGLQGVGRGHGVGRLSENDARSVRRKRV
jgi:hypothetical protein